MAQPAKLTSSECVVCKREVAVGIQQGVRVGGKWLIWRECSSCFLKFEKECSR